MGSGGKRSGSGRPKGSGKFGTETKSIRIPINEISKVLDLLGKESNPDFDQSLYSLPFYQDAISAGFPSPAEDAIEQKLDLNKLLIKRPAATFFLKVSGSSMIKAGIHDGDLLIVDRSLTPTNGKIVIASVNGELTVKRLFSDGKKIKLIAENDQYKPIDITEEIDLRFWGVVTAVIHAFHS